MFKNLSLTFILAASATVYSYGQSDKVTKKPEPARRHHARSQKSLAVGVQTFAVTSGVSLKYGFNKHAELQGTFDMFSSETAGMSFYGLRYVQKFPTGDYSHFYLFGGIGLLSYSYSSTDYYYSHITTTESLSAFGYNLGGGYEWVIGRIGLSAEAGYANFTISGRETTGGTVWGGGIHYYILQPRRFHHQGTTHTSLTNMKDDAEEGDDEAPIQKNASDVKSKKEKQ